MPPTDVIDLRDQIVCGHCAEPLAIAAYDYNGDPSMLRCADCAAAGVRAPSTSVRGAATFSPSLTTTA